MAEGDGGPPMLKPGDASMASPFTAKAASVLPCTDIIKQGRWVRGCGSGGGLLDLGKAGHC